MMNNFVTPELKQAVLNTVPHTLLENSLMGLGQWQWIGIIALVIGAYLIEIIAGSIASFLVNRNVLIFRYAPTDHLKNAIRPFRKLLFILILIPGIQLLNFKSHIELFAIRALLIVASVFTVWLLHRLVDLITYYLAIQAKKTETKFDDILVPLFTKTSFVVVYLFGAVLIAHNLTIDVTGLVAGLGIGGLAFAFAAKDTLANLFGSLMLILDRPFDIGDTITCGDIEGVVESVGFRSTRIRTFNDSLITISNGELANKAIDNRGKRRYRRLNTTLGLEYDTPPEKIEAFCEGIRQLILSYKWTRKDNFHVYFVNFGDFSLDIQLMVFWETAEYAREQQEKHRLMIDILRLAKEVGVSFAFPTQTVHMYKQESTTKDDLVFEKYLDVGITKAHQLVQKPLTLKNPRSNAKDEEQFGKNDIGL
jgi:MscS family membrane protein